MYKELDLSQVKARGWVRKFLENQAEGLTGNIHLVGEPFSLPTWDSPDRDIKKEQVFLGGINSIDDTWVPFEQSGYWIDGAIRAGRLADNDKLISLAGSRIYPAVKRGNEVGYIGPEYLKDGLSWPHAVYFRALTAEYTATHDEAILDALKKHYLRRPLTEAYNRSDLRIISVRNVADIETALWIYGRTGDERFLQMAKDSYNRFNQLFTDDKNADENSKMFDITLKGMLSDRRVKNNHGVTYCEICKLAAILYYYTGEAIYKKAAVNAFDKLYRDQMLIDGVCSSTEYLNGNDDSHAMHETCLISDMSWALGYLYMITGDAKYGDWVEDCVYNGGLGAVDDNFKGEQYFSCPNQAISDDHSNHVSFFRGRDWSSYAPEKFLACCAGNVHRFMPNLVSRAFMQDKDTLSAFVYLPCQVTVNIGDKKVTVTETTDYPFKNNIEFKINTDERVVFTLAIRKPCWAKKATIKINGEPCEVEFIKGTGKIKREFADNDSVTVEFFDDVRLIKNAKGISVKKGALLYALPIKERVVINGLRELNNPDFPRYSLYAQSKWSYALTPEASFSFNDGAVGEKPWIREQNQLSILVKAREVKNWKLKKVSGYWTRFKPRVKHTWEKGNAVFTPKVKECNKNVLGKEEEIILVPYATTRLRIAIFPIAEK